MKDYWCAFRTEIIWLLLLLTMALIIPKRLYGQEDQSCWRWPQGSCVGKCGDCDE